jgi:hypothetical protein
MQQHLQGKWALVTGASGGLGADFARELARMGMNLVLVARRDSLLKDLQTALISEYGVQVEYLSVDLSEAEAPAKLHKHIRDQGIEIEVLINNAGYGLYGDFLSMDWEKERNMLELDIISLTHMSKLFVSDMVAKGSGYVLQVSSIGAFQPTPLYASYSAAKSYVLSFSEALNFELRGTGVSSTAVAPGITATDFLKVSGQQMTPYQKLVMMQSPDVARIGIQAMLRRKGSVVPGFVNSVSAWSTRLMSRRLQAKVAFRLMKQ